VIVVGWKWISNTLEMTGKAKKIQEPDKQKYFPEISLQLFKRPEDYTCNTCVKHGNHQLCLKHMAG